MQGEKITGRTFWDFLAENLKLILTFITVVILLTVIALANNWITVGYNDGLVIGSTISQRNSMEYTHRIFTKNSLKGINLRTKELSRQELMQKKEYDETIIEWLTNGHPIVLLGSTKR